MLLFNNFPLSLGKILRASIEEKGMVAYKETWITPTSDFSSVNPDGRGQWNSLQILEEK